MRPNNEGAKLRFAPPQPSLPPPPPAHGQCVTACLVVFSISIISLVCIASYVFFLANIVEKNLNIQGGCVYISIQFSVYKKMFRTISD